MKQLTCISFAALAACATDSVDDTLTAASANCGPQPLALPCNHYVCTVDAGWVMWPNAAGTSCTSDVGSGQCDGGDPGGPGQQEPDRLGMCEVPAGAIDPHYRVLSVIYAPPGRTGGSASTVQYGQGSSLASQTETTRTFKQNYSLKASLKIPLISDLLNDTTANAGFTLTSTDRNSLALKNASMASSTHSGPPADGIDHDEDELMLWLNPRVYFAAHGATTHWTLEINPDDHTATDLDRQTVKIAWLKGTQPMPAGVAAELAHHHIAPADYPALIAHDEFARGNATVDPAQFVRTGMSFPYEPPTTPNGTPNTFNLQLANDTTVVSSTTKSRDNTVGASVSASIPITQFLLLRLDSSTQMTWTYQTTNTATATAGETASATIKGPSFGYTGPTNITVYYDTMYKTFLFDFVRTPAPALRGIVRSTVNEPLAHMPVFLRAGNRTYTTVTNRGGEYRFFDHAPGSASVWVTGSAPRDLKLTKDTITVDLVQAK